MDEPFFDWWGRFVWRWRWRRHLAWLNAESIRAQEHSFLPPSDCDCDCPRRHPGAQMGLLLCDLRRIEADMRELIHVSD